MNLNEIAKLNWGKHIRITMTDGEILEGKLVSYASAKDNEPDPESIVIERMETGELTELYVDEIEKVSGDA